MVLYGNQKWSSAGSGKSASHLIFVDDTDNSIKTCSTVKSKETEHCHFQIGSLVSSLQNEPSQISLLAGNDLEMLSDMDPNSVADIISDR